MDKIPQKWMQYQAIMDIALDGIYIMDLEGHLLEANDSFCNLLGYRQNEIPHLTISDLDPQYTKQDLKASLSSFVDKNTKHESRYTCKSGAQIHLEISTTGIAIDNDVFIFASCRKISDQKGVEHQQKDKAFHESDEQYSALIKGMTEGVVFQDADGKVLTCNPSAERILGLTQEEMAGRTAADPRWGEVHEDGSEFAEEDNPALVALRTGLPQTNKIMGLKRPDKDVVWISINAQPLFKPATSTPYAAVVTFTDITVRKQTEEMLKDTEAYLNAILNNAGDPIFVKDDECRLILVNDAFCSMFGLPRSEIIGKTLAENVPPEEREHFLAIDRGVLDTGEGNICEESLTVSGMPSRTILTRKTRFIDAKGKYFLVGVIHDISERKANEEALRKSEERLRLMTQNVKDYSIIMLDQQGRIATWNEGAQRLKGYTEEEIIGQPISIFYTSGDIANNKLATLLKQAKADGRVEDEGWRIRKDGSLFYADVAITSIHNDAGELIGFAKITHDISDRKRAEEIILNANESLEQRIAERTSELEQAKERAEQASRAKSMFLSRMSHELRTPMNAILGFSQVLQVESLNEEQQEFVGEIYQAGKHLLELINDLLDISSIENGRMEINIERVNLGLLTSQATQIIRPLLQQMEVTLIDQCSQEIMLLADSTRLKQILVNLLSNAAKYNQQGGQILINCKNITAERLRINIADTGIGISPMNIHRLFVPFERIVKPENMNIEGTGIGLALSKKMALLMNGDIGVESTLGDGSTFWIELPCVSTTDKIDTQVESQVQSKPIGKAKLLYVEDNAANLKLVEALLRKQNNLTLITATNGEYGLELAQRYRPQIILLDIQLPGIDGFGVLKALQKNPETQNIPVVAISADAMPLDVERGLEAGFCHYLTKPIQANELIEVIDRFLNNDIGPI